MEILLVLLLFGDHSLQLKREVRIICYSSLYIVRKVRNYHRAIHRIKDRELLTVEDFIYIYIHYMQINVQFSS